MKYTKSPIFLKEGLLLEIYFYVELNSGEFFYFSFNNGISGVLHF